MKIKLKKSDVVCWCPSAGNDFKSVLNWEMDKGNALKPNVFLFTDNSYEYSINNQENYNYDDLVSNFRIDFNEVEYHQEIFNELSFFNAEEIKMEFTEAPPINDDYHHLSPNEYINYMECCGNRGELIFNNKAQFGGKQLWIDGDLNLSGLGNIISLGPIAKISGWVNIKNSNVTKEDLSNIQVKNIYTDNDINILPIKKEGMSCITYGDLKIILMPFSNQELFECLINNSINIQSVYAKRTCDDFKYADTLSSIGVKEAMLGTMTGEEDSLIVINNDFRYKKIGEPFKAIASINDFFDFVQLYNLLEEGVSDRAKLFVENSIINNDIIMRNVIHYFLSQRVQTETLLKCLNYAMNKENLVDDFEYLNILPPITVNLDDFSFAIISFIYSLFTKEQIASFTVDEAIKHLN
jgi:hypothetical protein